MSMLDIAVTRGLISALEDLIGLVESPKVVAAFMRDSLRHPVDEEWSARAAAIRKAAKAAIYEARKAGY